MSEKDPSFSSRSKARPETGSTHSPFKANRTGGFEKRSLAVPKATHHSRRSSATALLSSLAAVDDPHGTC